VLGPHDHDQPLKRAIFWTSWVPTLNMQKYPLFHVLTLSNTVMYSWRMASYYYENSVSFFHRKSLKHQWSWQNDLSVIYILNNIERVNWGLHPVIFEQPSLPCCCAVWMGNLSPEFERKVLPWSPGFLTL
jgi:hypothetical protein